MVGWLGSNKGSLLGWRSEVRAFNKQWVSWHLYGQSSISFVKSLASQVVQSPYFYPKGKDRQDTSYLLPPLRGPSTKKSLQHTQYFLSLSLSLSRSSIFCIYLYVCFYLHIYLWHGLSLKGERDTLAFFRLCLHI